MKSELSNPSIDRNVIATFKAQKGSKKVINSPSDYSGSTLILWRGENTFGNNILV